MPRVRHNFRIRTYLLLLVLVSAVPFIAFSAILVTQTVASQTRGFGRDVTAVTRALSLALDSRMEGERTALQVLGRSPALSSGDLVAFHAEMQAAAALLNRWLSLSRPDGHQVLNTIRPYGTPLPSRTQAAHVMQVSATGRAAVSGFTRTALSGRPTATLDIPVAAPGGTGPPWVLAVTLELDDVEKLLRSQRLPQGWVGAVVDGDGLLLARTPDHDARVGTPASQDWIELSRIDREGWIAATTLEGVVTYTGYTRSDVTGWMVGIGVPRAVVRALLLQVLLRLAAFGAALTLVGAGAAVVVARRIARPISALARQDEEPASLDLVEAQQVAAALQAADAERRTAEAALRASEAELRVARELSLQSPWTADADGMLLTVSRRLSVRTGTAEAARLGRGWLDVVHPDDRADAVAAWDGAVLSGQPFDQTFRTRSTRDTSGTVASGPAHGSAGLPGAPGWVWVRSRAAALLGPDGRPSRWYGTTEDVDDRVRAQLALQVSEARLRHLT